MSRPLLTGLLFALVLFTPFWVYLPALVLAVVYMPFFYEAIAIGFLIDVLYGVDRGGISLYFPYAILVVVVIFLSIPLRERIRFHA